MIELEQRIKKANKDFYDIIGSSYDEIDGRRTAKLTHYIELQLKKISQNTDADSILDLGCGSGIIAKASKDYFKVDLKDVVGGGGKKAAWWAADRSRSNPSGRRPCAWLPIPTIERGDPTWTVSPFLLWLAQIMKTAGTEASTYVRLSRSVRWTWASVPPGWT